MDSWQVVTRTVIGRTADDAAVGKCECLATQLGRHQMYTANHYGIDMAKDHRQREIQVAEDYRLAREARAGRKSHLSGIGTAVATAVAVTARFLHVTRAH